MAFHFAYPQAILLAANVRRYDAHPASFLLAGGMKKVVFSLALGTFGLGMAEFGIMGYSPSWRGTWAFLSRPLVI